MASRFGRRKKAKLMDRISRLELELKEGDTAIYKAKRIIGHLYQVCPNSIAFKPAKITLDSKTFNRDIFSQSVLQAHNGETLKTQYIDFQRIDLYALKLEFKQDKFSNAIHFMATLQSDVSHEHYVISQEGMKNIDIKEISIRLAEGLKNTLAKGWNYEA